MIDPHSRHEWFESRTPRALSRRAASALQAVRVLHGTAGSRGRATPLPVMGSLPRETVPGSSPIRNSLCFAWNDRNRLPPKAGHLLCGHREIVAASRADGQQCIVGAKHHGYKRGTGTNTVNGAAGWRVRWGVPAVAIITPPLRVRNGENIARFRDAPKA